MGLDRLRKWLEDYLAHDDPGTRICNLIALVIVANQPFYPLYVLGAIERPEPWTLLTFLSTPLFAAVPAVARRSARAGRLLLALTGIANTVLATAVLGPSSGVLLFLIPCALIVAACFHVEERWLAAGLLGLALALYLGIERWQIVPLCQCSPEEASSLTQLHAISVSALVVLIGFVLRPKVSVGATPAGGQTGSGRPAGAVPSRPLTSPR
jgi:hypothetical protein